MSPKKCTDKFGCPHYRCPDFIIRRFDTKPAFKVSLQIVTVLWIWKV